MRESCVRPMIQSKLQKFWFQSVDVDGVYTETKNRVSEGTAVESEQGWFQLALYNLSNLFLMLTVQILFVSHFRKTLCKKKREKNRKCLFICHLNQNMVIRDSELSFLPSTGHTRSSLLLCNISKHLFAVFCRSKTSKFLNSSSFVLYLFYIIIQDPARLWLVD